MAANKTPITMVNKRRGEWHIASGMALHTGAIHTESLTFAVIIGTYLLSFIDRIRFPRTLIESGSRETTSGCTAGAVVAGPRTAFAVLFHRRTGRLRCAPRRTLSDERNPCSGDGIRTTKAQMTPQQAGRGSAPTPDSILVLSFQTR